MNSDLDSGSRTSTSSPAPAPAPAPAPSSPPSEQPMQPPPMPPPIETTSATARPAPTIVALPPPKKNKSNMTTSAAGTPSTLTIDTAKALDSESKVNTNVNATIHNSSMPKSPTSSSPNPSSVEEAAALLGACITRLSNQSVYRTTTPPQSLPNAFSTVKPIPCSELYQRLASLHSLLQQAADQKSKKHKSGQHDDDDGELDSRTLQAAPSIIPLLHKLLHLSSTLALTPMYLHSSNSTVPQQHLPQQILHNTLNSGNTSTIVNATKLPGTGSISSSMGRSSNTSSTSSSVVSNYNSNTNEKKNPGKQLSNTKSGPSDSNSQQVPPVRITPPLSSKPIRYLWVKCITLAHRLSPPPPSTQNIPDSSNSSGNNSSTIGSASTNILTPYLSYATSHPRSAKSCGGTRVSAFYVLEHIFDDDVLSKRFFSTDIHHRNHQQLILSELVTTCLNGLKSSGSNDVYHRIHAMRCIVSVFSAYRDNLLVERLRLQLQQEQSNHGNDDDDDGSNASNSFLYWNDMEERTIQEAIKVLKRATDDKYAEVRNVATQFASVLSTMLIHEKNQYAYAGSGSSGSGSGSAVSSSSLGFNYLDEVCQLCYRNLDDDSVQVGLGWSIALSRCMTSAVEYHTYIQQMRNNKSSSGSSNIASSPSNDDMASTGTTATSSTSNSFFQFTSSMTNTSNDLASKFKAFNENRKILGSIASGSCNSLVSAFQFLVIQFVRVGQNAVSSGGGGSGGGSGGSGSSGNPNNSGSGNSSSGGGGYVVDSSRYIRNGIGNALVQLCKLQCSIGGIHIGAESRNHFSGTSVVADQNAIEPGQLVMEILLNMVGPTFENQILAQESKYASSVSNSSRIGVDDQTQSPSNIRDATSSPKRKKIVEKSTSAMGSFFGGGRGGGGGGSNSGGSGVAQGMQSKKYVTSSSVAGMARIIVGRILRRGLAEMMTETMQLSLLRDLASIASPSSTTGKRWNRHQYQVAFVEISHLITTLGEASASALDDLIPSLQHCLSHSDHGVRFEAAIAFQAVTVAFPSAGRKYIMTMVDEIQVHHDEILAIANNREAILDESFHIIQSSNSGGSDSPSSSKANKRRGFQRSNNDKSKSPSSASTSSSSNPVTMKKNAAIAKSLGHQYALHGNALVLSMVLHVMPKLPGGLPSELLDIIIAVADNLISCQGNGVLSQSHPGAVVTCVRAGYCIISGALTMGVKPTTLHFRSIFGIWAKSAAFIDGDLKRLGFDVSCLDPFINSIVVFLRESAELLLSIPDALNRTSQILEKVLPVIMGYSQLERTDSSQSISSRLDSAKAAIMEAFSWLPPGSFPLVADSVFSFASRQIKMGVEDGDPCGLLPYLVTKEDSLLDMRCLSRVNSPRQTGGSTAIDDSLQVLSSEYMDHSQRESVLHFKTQADPEYSSQMPITPIRDLLVSPTTKTKGAPTPLHEVGTWKEPPTPSISSKERLMNAAVHVFAATFGLQGSHQQITAVNTLENSLKAGIGSKLELVSAINIGATLLSCLKALPTHDGADGSTSSAGPPWMSKAVDLFIQLLQSPVSLVRRSAAEGLGLLVSVSVKEEAHDLRKLIDTSISGMMRETKSENPIQQKHLFQMNSWRKSGALLAYGCIQRAAAESTCQVPTMKMIAKMLPSTGTYVTDEDSFSTRTSAIHSFHLLLSYSNLIEGNKLNDEAKYQVLSKAVEIIENNFFAAWKTNTVEIDVKIYEMEKFAFEVSFMTSLIRVMSYLVPKLCSLRSESMVINRFSNMVSAMIGMSDSNPSVVLEAIAFYESLLSGIGMLQSSNLQAQSLKQIYSFMSSIIVKVLPLSRLSEAGKQHGLINHCMTSLECQTSVVNFMLMMTRDSSNKLTTSMKNVNFTCRLFALLESISGSRQNNQTRCTVANTISGEKHTLGTKQLEMNVCYMITSLFKTDCAHSSVEKSTPLLQWILMMRSLISVDFEYEKCLITKSGNEDDEWKAVLKLVTKQSLGDACLITSSSGNTVRWQLKYFAIKILRMAFEKALDCTEASTKGIKFDLPTLRKTMGHSPQAPDCVLYLKDFLALACSVSTITIDQGEIYTLQNAGLNLLLTLIEMFGETNDADDPSPEAKGRVIENFSSQIIPSINHALSSCDHLDGEDSIATEGSRNLFISGCHLLSLVVKVGLVTDTFSMKRMLKTLILPKEELMTCFYPQDSSSSFVALHLKPKSFIDNRMSVLLPRIGKMSTLAKLCILGELKLMPAEAMTTMFNEMTHIQTELAIISTALALDAFRLLVASEAKDEEDAIQIKSGLTFPNLSDINEMSHDEMIQNWVSFCGLSSILITNSLEEKEENCEEYKLVCGWCEKLVIVLQAGFNKSLAALGSEHMAEVQSAEHACTVCLMALEKIMKVEGSIGELFQKEGRSRVLRSVVETILSPWVNNVDLDSDSNEAKIEASASINYIPRSKDASSLELVAKACEFVESSFKVTNDVGIDLIVSLLTPLIEIQENEVLHQFDGSIKSRVINSYISSLDALNRKDVLDENIIKALLDLCVKNFFFVHQDGNNTEAFSLLLRSSLMKDIVTEKDKIAYGSCASSNGNWATWEIICTSANDVQIIVESRSFILAALANTSDQSAQQCALIALCNVMKVHYAWIPNVMGILGQKIVELFCSYSNAGEHVTKQYRMLLCSTCLKIIMMSVQFMITQGTELPQDERGQFDAELAKYFCAIFEKFVTVISHNGLPNQQNHSNIGSDGVFGRMCAQFFVHILRSCPLSFKVCIGQLDERSRMILESSVRADMAGYVVQSTAPTKKKLNIKSFVSKK